MPHGQFMACVKAEFGWSQQWAHQLMAVAERFSNHNSSCDLPSSAKVLALLAASGADDATVQQAENCARAAIDIGLRLITLKELLPHGQFMACVKAEFQWDPSWCTQLMHIARRFGNRESTHDLPSSTQVLALLASSGATVQQAADWP